MLIIYLHCSQQPLLDEITHVCPDLTPARKSLYPGYRTYHAALAEGEAGLIQKVWLTSKSVLYVDTEAVRARRARVFVRHALLRPDEDRALSFSFARVADHPGYHRLRVRSRTCEATLYLRENWTGREQVPFAFWVGAIWVCRQPSGLVAYALNERGLLDRIIHCLPTEEEMTCWLLSQRYIHLYCFSHTPDICGLYCRIHDDGIPEIARVEI
jgi:hypothetical protein